MSPTTSQADTSLYEFEETLLSEWENAKIRQ